MKRIFFWVLAAALVLSLTATCWAAGEATLTSAKGGPGQTVYLTLELQKSVEASAIGVNCQFDETLLTAQPELSTWEREGLLFAFEKNNMGVWADEKPADLKGKLCVLAFQVNDGVAFDSTEVTVTLVLKDGAAEKGSYTAKGLITCECTHDYGPWESTGNQNHARVCSLCGGKSTQPHSWNDGEKQTQPDGSTLLVKTCTVCKAKTGMDVTEEEQGDSLLPGVGGDTDSSHDHTHDETPDTLPEHDHVTQDSHEGHDHSAGGENPYTLWIILAVVAVLVAAGVWFVKKKK